MILLPIIQIMIVVIIMMIWLSDVALPRTARWSARAVGPVADMVRARTLKGGKSLYVHGFFVLTDTY